MALNFQRFPIALAGLDTKVDDKQALPGTLTVAENVVFSTPGEVNKRHGLTSLSRAIAGTTGSISSGSSLVAYDDQLLLFDGQRVYSRRVDGWVDRGAAFSVRSTTEQVLRRTVAQHAPVMASAGGVELYAWENTDLYARRSDPGVSCLVRDAETGAIIVPETVLSVSGTTPQCVSFAGQLFVVWCTNGAAADLYSARRVDPLSPTTIFTLPTPITGNGGDPANYDVFASGSRLYWAFQDTAVGSSTFFKLRQFIYASGSLHQQGSDITLGTGADGSPAAAWPDRAGNVCFAYVSGNLADNNFDPRAQVRGGVVDPATGIFLMTASNFGMVSSSVNAMAGLCLTGSRSTLYLDLSSSLATEHRIVQCSFGPGLALPTPAAFSGSFARGASMASKPFVHGGRGYLWTVHAGDVQPTYFALTDAGDVVAKASPGVAGPVRSWGSAIDGDLDNVLPSVEEVRPGVFRVANQRRARLFSSGSRTLTFPGLARTELDFNSSSGSFGSAPFGDVLVTAGGILASFDGDSQVETGFHLTPEVIGSQNVLSGGSLSLNTTSSYEYVPTYEWTNNKGQIDRVSGLPFSTPTTPEGSGQATFTGSIRLQVSTLRLTAKQARSPVEVCLYRREQGSTVFYKVTDPFHPLYNTGSVDRVAFVDTIPDSELISREILYTEGDVLENAAAPFASLVTEFAGRLWMAGTEDPSALRYTKTRLPDLGAEFPAEFELKVDSLGGPITAIAPLDDQLIVFKRGHVLAVYSLTGDGTAYGLGPDNTGLNGSFSYKVVASDVGCVNPDSVVVTGMGVFFESAKGIYLLGRDMQAAPVGQRVEAHSGLTITSATLVPSANQVRWTTREGPCLVYDYLLDRWSTFTNHAAVDSVLLNDRFHILRSDGTVLVEDPTSHADDGADVPLSWETGWLDFGTIQGFKRVARMYLLGERKGPHRLQVRIAYDYRDYSQTEVIDATSTDEDSPQYQYRVDLRQQLVTAIKVAVTDLPVSGSQGYSLSNLAFEVGTLPGGPRLAGRRQT